VHKTTNSQGGDKGKMWVWPPSGAPGNRGLPISEKKKNGWMYHRKYKILYVGSTTPSNSGSFAKKKKHKFIHMTIR